MLYLKLFESFTEDFPNVFNGKLVRGSRMDSDEFVDDPSKRKVHLGDAAHNKDYRQFMTNWSKYGIPDPTKSIHMFFRPKGNNTDMYGPTYEIIPQKGAKFGFTKKITGGGLGSLFFDNWDDIPLDEYQQSLIDDGMVGFMTYDEIVEASNVDGVTLHVWTESPCLHKRIKVFKEPKSYKKEDTLTDEDFSERGLDNSQRSQFYKEFGRIIRDLSRVEALRELDKWVLRNNK
jgi:hypothetical protein